jgi:hypothetical protein
LARHPAGRPLPTHLHPKHGSWLNLIEGSFSKFARSVLRHIRVASKYELKERIVAGIDDVNRHPVMHTWSYRLAGSRSGHVAIARTAAQASAGRKRHNIHTATNATVTTSAVRATICQFGSAIIAGPDKVSATAANGTLDRARPPLVRAPSPSRFVRLPSWRARFARPHW